MLSSVITATGKTAGEMCLTWNLSWLISALLKSKNKPMSRRGWPTYFKGLEYQCNAAALRSGYKILMPVVGTVCTFLNGYIIQWIWTWFYDQECVSSARWTKEDVELNFWKINLWTDWCVFGFCPKLLRSSVPVHTSSLFIQFSVLLRFSLEVCCYPQIICSFI